ncbi:MAG: DUF3619 family protein [Methylophilaceae bacterium]|nr:DUF3619 family protein [Methylophilaceae bacterium]
MRDETRIAMEIVQALEAGARSLDPTTADKLASARRRAVFRMTQNRFAYVEPVLAGWHQLVEFSHHGGYRFWLPLLLLAATMFTMMSTLLPNQDNRPIDVDALLLASDLPPEAYANQEFIAWLENSSQR